MKKQSPEGIYYMEHWGIMIGYSTFVLGQVGIITTRSIAKGAMIFPVKGELLDAPTRYSFAFGKDKHIEPARINGAYNPGHYLNHSCSPNTIVRPTYHGNEPVIEVIARVDLPQGAELTFDYATLEYDVTAAGVECLCGSEICRGVLGGFKDLPDVVKEMYLNEGGVIAPYLLEIPE